MANDSLPSPRPSVTALTPSATRVLKALAKNDATYRELLIRLRPISTAGLTGAIGQLEYRGIAGLGPDCTTWRLTDAGRAAAVHA